MGTIKIKTQKAKGIVYGINHMFGHCKAAKVYRSMAGFMNVPKHIIIQNETGVIKNTRYPCFARPCPERPRHGFVDSRIVRTRKELMKLWKETINQDSNGEVALGPYMKFVNSSAIYVSSGSLVVGKGNDGATGGKKSISFSVAPHTFTKELIDKSGLTKEDTVYLESIYSDNQWWLTQIRGGPAIESISPNYIPKGMKIKKVVLPHDNLLEWERQTKEFKSGTVVYGNGYTLASHAAIHCVLNKIPFVTSYEPEIGKMLKAPKSIKIRKLNRERFKRGVRAGLNMCVIRHGQYNMLKFFYFSLSVLHNWAYIKHSEHADWLLGAATMLFVKTCVSLVHGEFRHNGDIIYKDRGAVYEKTMKERLLSFDKLPEIFENFYSNGWTDGFGGVPWANCTWYTHSLWTHIVNVYNKNTKNVTEKEITDLITIINRTVNVAHNNGWWFNKIAQKADMDFAANSPGLAAYCVAEIYNELYKKMQQVKGIDRKIKKPAKLKSPFTHDPRGRLAWIYLNYMRQKTSLQLLLEDGTQRKKTIKLSSNELKATRAFYNKEHKSCWEKTLLPTNSDGQFKILGGKFRNVGKVFSIKCTG